MHAAEQERPDVAEARAQWKNDQIRLDPANLIFVDETGASTKMARLYGRAKRGRRVIGRIPWGHWKTVTFVAAHLRKAKERTVPALYDRIGNLIGSFQPNECRNYFRKSGYAPT